MRIAAWVTTGAIGFLAAGIIAYVTLSLGGTIGGVGVLLTGVLAAIAVLRARADPAQGPVVSRLMWGALMLLPGALAVFLAFNAGGFFPVAPAFAAVLLALLLGAVLVFGDRRAGASRPLLCVAGLLGAYSLWVLISVLWSDAPWRALREFDLALLYVLGLVCFGLTVNTEERWRWLMRGLVLGATVVCVGAFLSRVLPRVWPISPALDTVTLGYPLTYPNAMGLFAAIGLIVGLAVASSPLESRTAKALSALTLPLLGATLMLTVSRGGIGAGIIGLIAYLVLGRSRSLLGALLASAAPVAIAVHSVYSATHLAQPVQGSPVAAAEGHHVLLVVSLCCVAAGALRWLVGTFEGRRLAQGPRHFSRRVAGTAWVGAALVCLVGLLALNVWGFAAHQYHQFVRGNVLPTHALVRDRLTDVGADQRIDYWRVALKSFAGSPVHGTGAGTYELSWEKRRPPSGTQVLDAHSLYFENLSELGIAGLALLVLGLLGALASIAMHLRGPLRSVYAAAFAVTCAWVIEAAFDWQWEMPAVTLPVLILIGSALATRHEKPASPGQRRRLANTLVGVCVLSLAVVPALVGVSQSRTDGSLNALDRAKCPAAITSARSAISALPYSPQAHETLAFCQLAMGQHAAAVQSIDRAVRDDPHSWEPRYDRAIVYASVGQDPRRALAEALALDPRETRISRALATVTADPPSLWPVDADFAELVIDNEDHSDLLELRQPSAAIATTPAAGLPRTRR